MYLCTRGTSRTAVLNWHLLSGLLPAHPSRCRLAKATSKFNCPGNDVQVASQRANGERLKLRLPLNQIPNSAMRRDIEEYDYEYEDDGE
jgi:hypothetical protein